MADYLIIYKVCEEGTGPREGGAPYGLRIKVSFKSSKTITLFSFGPAEESIESITRGIGPGLFICINFLG